jgi:hypothetical protein
MPAMPKDSDSKRSSPAAGRVSSNGASPVNGVMTTDDILLYIEQSTGPYGDTLRELVAEGFVPDPVHVAEIRAAAATWPE